MKKNNQKGFMLAEAFIVSTVVLGVLVFMFIQIRTIITGFDRSFSYDTVPGIYIANEFSKFIKNIDYSTTKDRINANGYVVKGKDAYSAYVNNYGVDVNESWNSMITSANVKTIIICKENAIEVKNAFEGTFSTKFTEYIKHLKVDDVNDEYRIIIEFNDNTYASIRM